MFCSLRVAIVAWNTTKNYISPTAMPQSWGIFPTIVASLRRGSISVVKALESGVCNYPLNPLKKIQNRKFFASCIWAVNLCLELWNCPPAAIPLMLEVCIFILGQQFLCSGYDSSRVLVSCINEHATLLSVLMSFCISCRRLIGRLVALSSEVSNEPQSIW